MKKTWVFMLGLILLIGGNSSFLTTSSEGVQTTNFLNKHVVCLDSIPGTPGECDSAHVYVLFGNADYPCYMARTTDCGGSWIDSIDYAGRLHPSYRFFDQVADCDCDSGAGQYEVIVTLFGSGVPTENSFSFELIDGNFNDLMMTMEPQTNRKNVYVKVDSSATNDGTSWDNACSIHKAVDYCTDAAEYFIYVAAGTYKDVEITDSIGHTHWIGSGADETKVWGIVEPNPALPAKHVLRLKASWDDGAYSDTSSVEVTGFEFHGYEATSGVEDSATLYALKINEPTSGFYIHDNVFYNFLRSIFVCAYTRHGRIENNWIGKPIKYGMEIGGGFEHRIHNNVIDSLLDGRVGVYVSGAQGHIVYSDNIINAAGGRGFHFTAASQRGVVVDNYVRAVVADSAFEDLGNNVFLANHIQSQISDPQTIQEDIAFQDVNVVEVDGDTSATKNLKRAFDGDSTTWAWKFQVRQLQVIADQGNNDAFYLSGIGSGSGLYATSAGNGYGIHLLGNTNSGLRIGCTSGSCDGAYIFGHDDGNGILINSGNSEPPFAAVFLDGLGTAEGLHIEGTNDAIMIKGGERGVVIDGKPALVCSSSTDNAIEIYGNQDIVLAGDGIIHGTIGTVTTITDGVSLNEAEAGSLNVISGNVDSLTAAISDVNKANFKATGFSVAGDPMTLQSDSLKTLMGDIDAIKAKTDNLPTDPADDSDIDAQLSGIQVDLDNPAQYKATGFATSAQGDSVTEAITDVNKANFKATGFSTSSDLDSLEDAITDANKANFKATGFATSSQGDSVTGAITDVNKVNFKATDFATSTQGDSVVGAIADANKANFKSTGFAVSGDPMTLRGDSLVTLMTDVDGIKTKTDNLPTDPADDSDVDAQLSSIQSDLDNPSQYKATGFATSAQGDSVTGAITDVNKDNFKFGMGEGDSVRAHLSTHDSTLLELAAGGASNWTNAQRDSVLKTIEDANKANYMAAGFAVAGDPMTLQGDSLATLMLDADSAVAAISDVNKANFKATGYAVAGDPMTLQGDSLNTLMADVDSAVQAIADANKPNFKATGFATAESVHTAITDDNKVNFKYGGGADSVRAYLATHDSTLLELAAGGASNWTDAQRDSILNTILDLNKPNFRASGFSVSGDPMTLKGDSLNTLMADVDGVKAKTDNLPTDPADDSDIDNQLSSIQQDLNNPSQYMATGFAEAGDPMTLQADSLATLMTDVDGVKTKTDNLPDDPADDSDIDAQLVAIDNYVDTEVQAIKDKTDNLPADPADDSDIDDQLLIIDNYIDTEIAAIKAKTDNLPPDPADDSDLDAQLNSIATDLNDPDQYKADVWANVDTTDADTSDIGVWLVNNTGGAGGGSDTTSIKAMMQKNWDADTDGELSVETSTGADSSVMKKMMQNNWDPDTDGELSVELPAGSGSDTLDIIVFDGDTTAVEGVDLCIYNPTKTAKAVPKITTDVNGCCQVNLDPGSYPTWCQRLGIIQAEWDTVTVASGGGRDTIWVVAQAAGSPPSANVTRLTGYNRDLGYNKNDRLKIVMKPQHANLLDTCQNIFIITKEIVAYSDTGCFEIDVTPSKCLLSKDGPVDIDSVLYDFLIFYKYNKEFERRGIFVPDSSGNVQVKDLLD